MHDDRGPDHDAAITTAKLSRAAMWPARADRRRTSIQITAAPARASNASKASRRTRLRRAEAVPHVKVGLADRRWMTMAVARAFRRPFIRVAPGDAIPVPGRWICAQYSESIVKRPRNIPHRRPVTFRAGALFAHKLSLTFGRAFTPRKRDSRGHHNLRRREVTRQGVRAPRRVAGRESARAGRSGVR